MEINFTHICLICIGFINVVKSAPHADFSNRNSNIQSTNHILGGIYELRSVLRNVIHTIETMKNNSDLNLVKTDSMNAKIEGLEENNKKISTSSENGYSEIKIMNSKLKIMGEEINNIKTMMGKGKHFHTEELCQSCGNNPLLDATPPSVDTALPDTAKRYIAHDVIRSSRLPIWADGRYWGNWEYCPPGTYATAFQLKFQFDVEDNYSMYHDSFVNGIGLYCNKIGENARTTRISSKAQSAGEWRNISDCPTGVISGYQLSQDDTSIDNFRFFCTGNNSNVSTAITGRDGKNKAPWTQVKKCLPGQAVCGIRTQVADTGLAMGTVDMACCDVPELKITCTPRDEWEVVVSCDNLSGSTSQTCVFNKTQGVLNTNNANNNSLSSDITSENIGAEYKALRVAFTAGLNKSSKTGLAWSNESYKTFSEQVITSADFTVDIGSKSELRQVVGYCGNYIIRSSTFVAFDV